MTFPEIIDALTNDEVVVIDSKQQRNELFDYMLDNDIEPSNYRIHGNEIWLA